MNVDGVAGRADSFSRRSNGEPGGDRTHYRNRWVVAAGPTWTYGLVSLGSPLQAAVRLGLHRTNPSMARTNHNAPMIAAQPQMKMKTRAV